jgi:hypothetical protein
MRLVKCHLLVALCCWGLIGCACTTRPSASATVSVCPGPPPVLTETPAEPEPLTPGYFERAGE